MIDHITFEISSKAFYDDSNETMQDVCRKLMDQWRGLIADASDISLLFWLADGSEILDYAGNLDDNFEWAYWIGTASPDTIEKGSPADHPRNLSYYPVKYRENITPRNYRWVKNLLATFRELFAKPIRIGAAFDPGREFAYSDFKINRHPEIRRNLLLFKGGALNVGLPLKADSRKYAAYPTGIPDGTRFGEFLGKQFSVYSKDMGFDYIWLSNGMGFGFETWNVRGAIFDGKVFHCENTEHTRKGMLDFWTDLTGNLPGMMIETRGSNLSAGIEMASDAAPLKEIFDRFHIAVPVNSPWAALNYNTGVELAGWMSHIAVRPNAKIPFRYYINDPWWINSPWLDRYEREPWDIYLPLSVSVVNERGVTEAANSISIMTVDDSLGVINPQIAEEVLPHLHQAMRTMPDQAGPLVWLYPFDEYNELIFGDVRHPEAVFGEDWFISSAIQNGLPLNTVMSDRAFYKSFPRDTVLVAPMSAMRGKLAERTLDFITAGGRILFYGPAKHADPKILSAVGLQIREGVQGEFTIESKLREDRCAEGESARAVTVYRQFCGGLLCEDSEDESIVRVALSNSNCRRVVAVSKGNLAWTRSLVTSREREISGSHILPDTPSIQYPVERIIRYLLAEFGIQLNHLTHTPDSLVPRMNIHRSENALWFSVFCPDTTVETALRMPHGVPVFSGVQTRIAGNTGYIHFPKTCRYECRIFVEGCGDSIVTAKDLPVGHPSLKRKIEISGLHDAKVTYFPQNEADTGATVVYEHINDKLILEVPR